MGCKTICKSWAQQAARALNFYVNKIIWHGRGWTLRLGLRWRISRQTQGELLVTVTTTNNAFKQRAAGAWNGAWEGGLAGMAWGNVLTTAPIWLPIDYARSAWSKRSDQQK